MKTNQAPQVATLANGLRAVAIPMPWRQTVAMSVFIRTGSLNESARLNGISHVVEHMAFKGTAKRDCQRINLDAESLGAEVNAHTDKDHTAFHIEGLPQDLPAFIELLADIVLTPSFPADELERELRVIEQEFNEFEEDPVSAAFQLFDRACYGGTHPAGRPVIGKRANLKRFKREDLVDYITRQYSACNMVVAVAGPVDFKAFVKAVEAAFGAVPAGEPNEVAPPTWEGGLRTRRMPGSGQCQVVLGYPAPALADDGAAQARHLLAAAVLGEGMSSPLLDEIRERRGLAYHVSCTTDIYPLAGQLLIEAATGPKQAEELLTAVDELLQRHAEKLDRPGLDRARRQLRVRALRGLEQPARRLEAAAQVLGLPPGSNAKMDYVSHPSVLDRQMILELQAHLERIHAVPWWQALLAQRAGDLSEFTLYGSFVDNLVSSERFFCAPANGRTRWVVTAAERSNVEQLITSAFESADIDFLVLQASRHWPVEPYKLAIRQQLAQYAGRH